MQTSRAPGLPGSAPAHRLLALVVTDLDLDGDEERGAAPVHGLDLEIEAGTLVFLSPPERGRTVILHLSADAGVRTGNDGRWRCVLAPDQLPHGTTVQESLEAFGPHATATARRLGLGSDLRVPLLQLEPGARVLARLAAACAGSPDIVALDDPTAGLDDDEAVSVVAAIRDLVDTDGRTVIVTCDPFGMPATARQLASTILEIGDSPRDARLLTSQP